MQHLSVQKPLKKAGKWHWEVPRIFPSFHSNRVLYLNFSIHMPLWNRWFCIIRVYNALYRLKTECLNVLRMMVTNRVSSPIQKHLNFFYKKPNNTGLFYCSPLCHFSILNFWDHILVAFKHIWILLDRNNKKPRRATTIFTSRLSTPILTHYIAMTAYSPPLWLISSSKASWPFSCLTSKPFLPTSWKRHFSTNIKSITSEPAICLGLNFLSSMSNMSSQISVKYSKKLQDSRRLYHYKYRLPRLWRTTPKAMLLILHNSILIA